MAEITTKAGLMVGLVDEEIIEKAEKKFEKKLVKEEVSVEETPATDKPKAGRPKTK